MAFQLTEQDLARAEAAAKLLLSPLEYADLNGWRSDVMHSLQELVGAELGAFLLPGAGGEPLYDTTGTPSEDREYLSLSEPVFREFKIVEKLGQDHVATITSMMEGKRSNFTNTTYFQEFLKSKRCFESISLAAGDGHTGDISVMPHVHLHKSREEERFAERDMALLRLLLPAFQAGVEIVQRVRERREGLLRVLDKLGDAIVLVSAGGEVLHVSRAVSDMAARDAQFNRVEADMVRTARDASRSERTLAGAPLVSDVATAAARYRMRTSLFSDELIDREPAVLVSVERMTPMLPTVAQLRELHGLTRRQAEVALLLANGMTDNAIAEKLFISPHTARNHSKRVLVKLGVHSRAAVRPVLDAA